jgi:hypothetical protein
MLVVTPKPHKTESLFGYALRVSEENGYSSPASVLSIAGYADLTLRSSQFQWQRLSKVLGGVNLSKYSYTSLSVKLTRSADKKPIDHLCSVPGLWRLNAPQICIKCIEEIGYVEAHWDLACMVACPEHGDYGLSSCHQCSSDLKWGRQGLLTCHCGADLRKAPKLKAPKETIKVVDFFKKLFYGNPVSDCLIAKQNSSLDWTSVSFVKLTSLMRILVKKFPFVPFTKNDYINYVDNFGKIFSNWPVNYHDYLASIGGYSVFENGHAPTFIKQYSSYYGAIKSKRKYGEFSDLLISEFVKFGFEVYGQAFLDERLIKRVIGDVQPRYLSPMQASRLSGISPVTLRKWAKKGVIDSLVTQAGAVQRVVLDLNNEAIRKAEDGEIFMQRNAAAYIGLPVSVLSYLDEHGLFRHSHKSKEKYGFHVTDLDDFAQRMIDLSTLKSVSNCRRSKVLSLAYILTHKRFRAASGKSEFVAEYMRGNIVSAYRLGTAVKDIYFLCSDVEEYVETQTQGVTNSGLSLKKVAIDIDFPYDIVSLLYDTNFINGKRFKGAGLRLNRNSVSRFKAKYCSINSVSKICNTGIERLIKYCDKEHSNIGKYFVERESGSKCFFITREDSKALIRYVERLRQIELKKLSILELMPTKAELLDKYFNELVINNERLPRRAGVPNLIVISANIDGVHRNDFYVDEMLRSKLNEFDEDDRDRFALTERDDLKALVSYLDRLVEQGLDLPLSHRGKPNKLEIAKACGIDRNYFYKCKYALELINAAI